MKFFKMNFFIQAVVPLMKYLETELKYMNENLVQENFNRYPNAFYIRLLNTTLFILYLNI